VAETGSDRVRPGSSGTSVGSTAAEAAASSDGRKPRSTRGMSEARRPHSVTARRARPVEPGELAGGGALVDAGGDEEVEEITVDGAGAALGVEDVERLLDPYRLLVRPVSRRQRVVDG